MAEAPSIERIAGIDVFRIENNAGVQWDDVIRSSPSLNEVPVRVFRESVDAQGTFSNREIMVAIALGQIVQYPPAPELINGSSVDVRLGHYFYRTDVKGGANAIYNPHNPEDIARYFGQPLEAQPLHEYTYLKKLLGGRALRNIDPEIPLIVMRPHERILAHTLEFIGIKAPGTTSMQAKSTTGRNGIVVCKDAGWGDPGYIGRWTMEIQNDNDEHVVLQEGMPIAQLAFYATGPVEGDYTTLSGNYQQSPDLSRLVPTWRQPMMLPRSDKMKVIISPHIAGLAEGIQ